MRPPSLALPFPRLLEAALTVLACLTLVLAPAGCAGSDSASPPTTKVGDSSLSTSAGPSAPATPPSTAVASGGISTTSISTSTSTSTSTSRTTTAVPLEFDAGRAMDHVEKLAAEIGVRHGGTEDEMAAVKYAADYLRGLGYEVEVTDVPLPNGRTSHNVVADEPGASTSTILIGAHMDSWGPSPGANDNASGYAAVLELARDLKNGGVVPSVRFVLFGNEEMIDQNTDHHHYGSRAYVTEMSEAERAALVGMISVDMIAYGGTFTMRTMGKGPQELRGLLKDYAKRAGVALKYEQDPSSVGWSDHEPFELAGFPAVWVEWRADGYHHTAKDTFRHVNAGRLGATGQFLLGFIRDLDQPALDRLADARSPE